MKTGIFGAKPFKQALHDLLEKVIHRRYRSENEK